MIRSVVTAAKWLVLLVAGIMLLLSLDVFDLTAPWQELLVAFLIHAVPGLAIIIAAITLWKCHREFGFATIAFGVALLLVYGQLGEPTGFNWSLLILVIPLMLSGSILIWDDYRKPRNE